DPDSEPVIAQTIDLNGNFAEFGRVIRCVPESPEQPEMLLYTFAGLLGYLGLNSAGLAVGINMVLSSGWQPGVSPYLLVRHLLAQTSIAACLHELDRIRRSSSRSLVISDSRELVNVEMTAGDLRVRRGPRLFHTNHYLHPDLVAADRVNILSRNSSIRRLRQIEALVDERGADLSSTRPERPEASRERAETLFELLSDHSIWPVGICAHAEGQLRRSDTVGAVVMFPAQGRLLVRRGHPCVNQTREFTLSRPVSPG
ncbi:MAG: C45 family peptidase, partial [Myxococcota bacterium]